MNRPKIVSSEEWLKVRKQLLEKEKELTRRRDELAEARRALPWVRMDKNYVFDGPNGQVKFADLFEGRSQLAVYHFMLGPGWKEGCPSCSMIADHIDGATPHLNARDVTLVAVSRAPYAEIARFKARMGWKFPWVSSHGTSFNHDFNVSFSKDEVAKGETYYNFGKNAHPSEEAPGLSVFYKDENGDIFHTYSTYARGLEPGLLPYFYLDLVPKGRDEGELPWPMAWVRHHDKYQQSVA